MSGGSAARGDWGVVLVNTGTPDAPQSGAVRRYLRRFLSDRRVIEAPRWFWLPLLNAVILPVRAPRSAAKYRRVWLEDGGPLQVHCGRLAAALARELHAAIGVVPVQIAYLYSGPGVSAAFAALAAAGVRRVVLLPLFPQMSATTTGAVYDQAGAALARMRALPELRLLSDYAVDRGYLEALAASVRDHWRAHGRGAHLLMSFHGIPQSGVRRGDQYGERCRATATGLAAALGLDAGSWSLAFQSRFGPARWLGPSASDTLRALPGRGVRALDVICPGFAVDCLETLEEIAIEGRATFLRAGGERYAYVGALNARSDHARALAALLLDATRDWR
ncbi:MAG: ferrochelatase [Gammaproteobacteria bacterium]|nr:ferrochelatase [Gammaproteobacteria bacterium]